jgi:hypothetical protein
MSRQGGSKADEASNWRRTTALQRGGDSSQPSTQGGHPPHQRPATADVALLHASSRGAQEPAQKPLPRDFSAADAQGLLDKRWAEVMAQQGVGPATPQCSAGQGSEAGAAAAGAADGSSGFLEALQKAVKSKSADAAWDD